MKILRYAKEPKGDEMPLLEGSELWAKFCQSERWGIIYTYQDYANFPQTNTYLSVTVREDRLNGTLVKESRTHSPKGHTLTMVFEVIPEWPEPGFDEGAIIPF